MNERAIREEGDFLENLDSRRLRLIHDAAIQMGEPEAKVRGLLGWLVVKATGGEDTTSPNTRSGYRKILARIADGDGGGNGRTKVSREAGSASRRALEVVGGGAGTVAIALANPAAGAVAAWVYITRIMGVRVSRWPVRRTGLCAHSPQGDQDVRRVSEAVSTEPG